MKGILLAGGLGTRLLPATSYVNKHLLPIYSAPMILYPLETLVRAGIDEVAVVLGGQGVEGFFRLLRNGEPFGLRCLRYLYQDGEGGIADALGLAEDFAAGEPVAVILGDNVFLDADGQIRDAIATFSRGARLFLAEVTDPERFGVPEVAGAAGSSPIRRLVEKPERPPSRYAATGLYLFDAEVFRFIADLQPSARGELEIVDVHNRYLAAGALDYVVLSCAWLDAGTPDSMRRATNSVAERAAGSSVPALERARALAAALTPVRGVVGQPGAEAVARSRSAEGVTARR